MSRIKLSIPDRFLFTTVIPIRITDINYGGHVGNDTILSLIHEARMQFLQHLGHTEMNLGGAALIMSDAVIEFKREVFYGSQLTISVTATDISRVSFNLFYLLEDKTNETSNTVALARTAMVCYDYTAKKVTSLPPAVKQQLGGS